ncbi:MFS transporter [Lentilactobacillus sp. Marseille-Q4993]|uniref:MFS transporter n=1 Tax=Lentilactobacillus sp. Marseille-Q4993 TaxID=3039492 RepID=UPI0024BD0855|nr:MFS transporter [Lentilactobacillus sp. Marseille-Q4993]
MAEEASTNRDGQKAFLVITIIALMTFLGVLVETSMNVTFPTIMKQFNVSLDTVQWVTTGYLLTVALTMTTSAYLKRKFTNKTLFLAGTILFIVGDLMSGLAPNYWILLLGRLIQAGCVGITGPLMNNIILEIVPRHKLGTYMGMANLIVLVGPALGPSFGGLMVSISDWRMIFWGTLPIAAILLLLGASQIKQYSKLKTGYEFDWGGFVALSVALVALMLGINSINRANGVIATIIGLAISIVAFVTFYKQSKRTSRKLFEISTFKDKVFLYSFLPYIFLQLTNISINFLLPSYVQIVNHASSFVGGLILLPGSVINGFGQPIYGWMLDRYGAKLPLYLGNFLFASTLAIYVLFIRSMDVVMIAVIYTVFAAGRSMAFGNSMTYGLKKIDDRVRSDANAIYGTGQQVAGSIGTTISAALMSSISIAGMTHAQNIAVGSQLTIGLFLVLGLINFGLYRKLFRVTD